jgi:hypothetical protein
MPRCSNCPRWCARHRSDFLVGPDRF